MNSYSHYHMSRILLYKLQKDYGLTLPRYAFIWGNIRPDFSLKCRKKPHYYQEMEQDMQEMAREMVDTDKGKLGLWFFSDRLGVICHYLCDFFCYAHSDQFAGEIKDHIRYEAKLNHYIRKRVRSCKDALCLEKIEPSGYLEKWFKDMQDQHRQYAAYHPNYGLDMICSLQACMESAVQILTFFSERHANATYRTRFLPDETKSKIQC